MRQARTTDLRAVDVPEWGQKVYLRPLSAREQMDIEKMDVPASERSLRILLLSIVDEDGNRLLADDDFDLILDQPFPVLIPLLKETGKVNGFDEAEVEEAMQTFERAQGGRKFSA